MHVRKIIRKIRKVGRYLGNYGKFYSEGKTPFANGVPVRENWIKNYFFWFAQGGRHLELATRILKGGRHLEMAFYPIFSNMDAICKWRLAFTVEFAVIPQISSNLPYFPNYLPNMHYSPN
ncbi:hypothetical protein GQ457_03G041480 [Hibiscus cannabinus]